MGLKDGSDILVPARITPRGVGIARYGNMLYAFSECCGAPFRRVESTADTQTFECCLCTKFEVEVTRPFRSSSADIWTVGVDGWIEAWTGLENVTVGVG